MDAVQLLDQLQGPVVDARTIATMPARIGSRCKG